MTCCMGDIVWHDDSASETHDVGRVLCWFLKCGSSALCHVIVCLSCTMSMSLIWHDSVHQRHNVSAVYSVCFYVADWHRHGGWEGWYDMTRQSFGVSCCSVAGWWEWHGTCVPCRYRVDTATWIICGEALENHVSQLLCDENDMGHVWHDVTVSILRRDLYVEKLSSIMLLSCCVMRMTWDMWHDVTVSILCLLLHYVYVSHALCHVMRMTWDMWHDVTVSILRRDLYVEKLSNIMFLMCCVMRLTCDMWHDVTVSILRWVLFQRCASNGFRLLQCVAACCGVMRWVTVCVAVCVAVCWGLL